MAKIDNDTKERLGELCQNAYDCLERIKNYVVQNQPFEIEHWACDLESKAKELKSIAIGLADSEDE